MNKHYDKLIRTLRTLFEMDRADLDFGFYRIMHAKAEQVQEFIEKDLLLTVKDAFGEQSSKNTQELLEQARQKVIQTLGEDAIDADGNLKPAFSSIPAGKQYQDDVAQILRQKDDASSETDVYDHLCRFFERYYEGGDFVSRRYYARETSGKAAPYAIPYNGEEVKLHWANADQYYIKTTENYNNFSFDLRQAREVQTALKDTPLLAVQDETDKTNKTKKPLRVHFRIKEASEGEHGNVKATDATKRFFVLHSEQPVKKDEAGELVVNFEYKPLPGGKYAIDTETEKQLKGLYGSLNKGDQPAFDMATQIIAAVESMEGMAEYHRLMQVLSPTEKIKKRPLLVRYLNKYTASNTMDYFIHKDLGGFLRRELDFYIKNEVMHLDDIENADAPAVESYLTKIKVLRKIAGKLIDFLAQLENFQKKLWLKKKFVVGSDYCLTLDRVPEELFGEIVRCDEQWEEWVGLGFCTTKDTKSTKKREEILGKAPYLVVDTKFYGGRFKERLLASFENLDEQCDGLLIHSENFQALSLLQERYREQVKCVYIDPPYNTGKDDFLYKDSYQHSSWLSFILDRISLLYGSMRNDGALFCSIDDNESKNIEWACNSIFGEENLLAPLYIQVRFANKTLSEDNDFHRTIEHVFFYAKNKRKFQPVKDVKDYPIEKFEWEISEKSSGIPFVASGKQCFVFKPGEYEIKKIKPSLAGLKETWATGSLLRQKGSSGEFFGINLAPRKENDGLCCLYKVEGIGEDGLGYRYFTGPKKETATKGKFYSGIPLQTLGRIRSGDATKEIPIHNCIDLSSDFGNCRLEGRVDIRGGKKPEKLLKKLIGFSSKDEDKDIVLEPYSGSGTAASVAHKLGKKYVAIEQNEYFDSKILVRMKYTLNGSSRGLEELPGGLIKYLRLESYEDTLNNLLFDENKERDKVLAANPSLKEDYTLNYLLDVETRGSQSLLNIDSFADPCRYTLKVKKPGSEEYTTQNVDLIETFNYLIGLRVTHLAASQTFKAAFKRNPDPELPKDQHTKLMVDGTIRQDENGPWWFRKIEGWLPNDPANPNNGQIQKILIVWRNLSGDLEKDNAVLDEWFLRNRISTQDFEFDTIYVNGSNNLPNLQKEGDTWKVRLIEEEFMKKMWDVEAV